MTKPKLVAFFHLTRLNRPIGIYLVLWPALWALWLASDGNPSVNHLVIFVLGAVVMRSAGCVINDYADRDWDGEVSRTCDRPLATGMISPNEALVFFGFLCLMALILVFQLNLLTVWMSFGAAFLAILYPFMKRFTYWPQVFLGAAFAWAIPMAFTAVQSTIPWQAWVIFLTTMVWALIYDTAYAMTDKADDLKVGIKSTAILFGDKVNLFIGLFQGLMLALLIWIGYLFELNVLYSVSVMLVAVIFIYHQKKLASQEPQVAFKVFLNNHWVGLVVLLGIVSDTNIPFSIP